MDLTQEVRQKALEVGFDSIGITAPEKMWDLPYGWVADVRNLRPPGEFLPGAKSVIVLAFHTWDRAFFLHINSPMWEGYGFHSPDEGVEGFYVSSQVTMNKAWAIVSLLRERGHQAVISTSIPLKTSAIRSGLGCQGKNTLLVHPTYSPRVGLMAILTTAELDVDGPFAEDLCGYCTRCVEACPTGALEPYEVDIDRCIAYAAENPGKEDIPRDVRELERKLTVRPTKDSYIECTICMDACPIGRGEHRLG